MQSAMKILPTRLPEVLLFEPEVRRDARGYFVETWRANWLAEAGIEADFVQENQSLSRRGVLRGLHFQWPQEQGKLVRVVRGKVFDVAVDVRRGSPTFGAWTGTELDDDAHRQLWIPPGFAHGFCVLSEEAVVVYRCTAYYAPQAEAGIRWDDPDLGIAWPRTDVPFTLSPKDAAQPRLAELAPERLPVYRGAA